jgi:hypothetical protein
VGLSFFQLRKSFEAIKHSICVCAVLASADLNGEKAGGDKRVDRHLYRAHCAAHSLSQLLLADVAVGRICVEVKAQRDADDPLKERQAPVGDDAVDPV